MREPISRSPRSVIERAGEPKSVAIFSKMMPQPAPQGHLKYMYAYVQFLESRGHRVHIVLSAPEVPFVFSRLGRLFPSGRVTIHAPNIHHMGRWHLVTHPTRVAKNLLSKALTPFPSVGAVVKRRILRLLGKSRHTSESNAGAKIIVESPESHHSQAGIRFAAAALSRIDPAVVFFNMIFTVQAAEKMTSSATKYVITHDVYNERHATLVARGFEVHPRPLTPESEAQLLMKFDSLIAIQPQEAESLATLCPDREVLTIPFPVTLVEHDMAAEKPGRCLFAANAALTNVDGLNWFLSEVWPSIMARAPHATLHVCGAVCEEIRTPLAGVIYRGIVPSLKREFEEAALVILPMRSGSGLKIKAVEALAHGLPCVTTTIGAQGLSHDGELPYLVADTPERFADQVVELLSDEPSRRRLSAAALALCAQFTAERVFKPLMDRGL